MHDENVVGARDVRQAPHDIDVIGFAHGVDDRVAIYKHVADAELPLEPLGLLVTAVMVMCTEQKAFVSVMKK